MRLVIDDVTWFSRLEDFVETASKIFEARLNLSKHGLAACDLMEVRPDIVHVPRVLYLSNEAIDVQSPRVESVPLCSRGEKFSHYEDVWVLAAGHVEQVLRDMNRSGVGVVQPEAIKDTGHLRDVAAHVLPEVRRVCWAAAVPQLDAVAPDVDGAPKIVEVSFVAKAID